jgi:hypothetical protein
MKGGLVIWDFELVCDYVQWYILAAGPNVGMLGSVWVDGWMDGWMGGRASKSMELCSPYGVGAHPASYPMGTRGSFSGDKAVGS